jgi:hypothetical protein
VGFSEDIVAQVCGLNRGEQAVEVSYGESGCRQRAGEQAHAKEAEQ